MKIKFIFLTLILIFIPALTFPQTNRTESVSFTTYFPSPNAAFDRMEVRGKLIVGNITDSNTAENNIANINDINTDQIFVADSIILGSQNTTPAIPLEGMIYFNNSSAAGGNKLEFNNGNWQKLGP